MRVQGVLISSPATPINKEGRVCSGILFADKWILTIGTLLDAVLQDGSKSHEHSFKRNSPQQIFVVPQSLQSKLPQFTVLVNNDTCAPKQTASKDVDIGRNSDACKGVETAQRCQRHTGKLAALWRCPLVSESTNQLLGGWQLTPTEEESSVTKALLSTFLLLSLDGEPQAKQADVLAALRDLGRRLQAPRRGEEVVVESTVFGREFFFNSWSQGIVSSVFGNGGSLLLTDARSATGCEGGPIFALNDNRSTERSLVGMVLSPVSWWKGEWVGFTVGVALQPAISRLHPLSPGALQPSRLSATSEDPCSLDSSVVLVRCGPAWGSGVVVDSSLGLILTCSHVARTGGLSVCCKGVSLPATLVYFTKSDLAYDLALIRVTPHKLMQQVVMADSPARKGERVIVAGYPMFSEREHRHLVPVLSRGIVSHVSPAMVQTTCCVQSGASGGPVLRAGGEMLALICCNTNNLDSGALFPHVNMAVPTAAFARHVRRYIDTQDVEVLRPLEEPDQQVQKMWKLQFTSSKL